MLTAIGYVPQGVVLAANEPASLAVGCFMFTFEGGYHLRGRNDTFEGIPVGSIYLAPKSRTLAQDSFTYAMIHELAHFTGPASDGIIDHAYFHKAAQSPTGALMMRIAITLFAASVALMAPRTMAAQTPTAATLADLAFMAGCWRGELGNDGALEEIYTSPSDNLMLGLSRYLRGEQAVQFEFARITADSTGIALLPFPGGRPSEHTFRLTTLEADGATFEAPEHDFPKRIRYARDLDGSLTARIDGGTNASRSQEWRMEPVPCRPTGR